MELNNDQDSFSFHIVISGKDTAGMNIFDKLIKNYEFKKTGIFYVNNDIILSVIEDETIYAQDLITKGNIVIFATKHQSKEKIPTLTCHTPGNWGKAVYGGKDKDLCISPSQLLKNAFIELEKRNNIGFEVSLECTHHGPSVQKPSIFIEIGSSEENWKNPDAGRIIADTIMSITRQDYLKGKSVFGIGGPHYCNNFNKLIRRTEFSAGHICPKYMLKDLTYRMVKEAISKTIPKDPLVVLDWKGLGSEKQRIIDMLETNDIKYKRIKDLI